MGIVSLAALTQAGQSVPHWGAAVLAYITKNYPAARLLAMTEVPAAAGNPSTYKAELAVGRRPVSLLFNGRGGFISEVSSARWAAEEPNTGRKKPLPPPGAAFSVFRNAAGAATCALCCSFAVT
ncbi:hypothetical protein ACVWYF_001201 [Hymenobacter sp. UYAg731]